MFRRRPGRLHDIPKRARSGLSGQSSSSALEEEVDVDEEAVARAVVQVKQAMAAEQAAARQLVENALCPRAPPNPPESVRRPQLCAAEHTSHLS